MSIRPIDFQVSITRSSEVNRANDIVGKTGEQQQAFASELEKQTETENQQVNQTNKGEYNRIDVDEDRRERRQRENQKSKKEKKDKNKNKKDDPLGESGSLYDISI